MNRCIKCGVEISEHRKICKNCDNKKIAIVLNIVFAIIYELTFWVFWNLSEIGSHLGGGETRKLSKYVEIARFAAPCFLLSGAIIIIGSIFAKKAKLNTLFIIDLIIIIINIICFFI